MSHSELVFCLFHVEFVFIGCPREVRVARDNGSIFGLDAEVWFEDAEELDDLTVDRDDINVIVGARSDKFDQKGPFFDLVGRVWCCWSAFNIGRTFQVHGVLPVGVIVGNQFGRCDCHGQKDERLQERSAICYA